MSATKQDLVLNVLPFDHPRPELTAGFYTEKKNPNMYPLQQHEFPLSFRDSDPNPAGEYEVLYTDFSDPEEAELQATVDLTRSTRFASHYYNSLVFKAMRGIANFRNRNFIRSNQLWFRDKEADHGGLFAYKKFVLKVTVGRYTRGPELSVMFDGHSYVYPHSVHEYLKKGKSTELNRVLFKGFCFKFEDIPDDFEIDYSKVYPVVNNTMRDRLGVHLPFRYGMNKMKRYYDEIEAFKREYLIGTDFHETIPTGEDWLPVEPGHYKKVSNASNLLVFGEGETDRIPYLGIQKHGPYRPPANKHFRIFFIMHESDRRKSGAKLYRYLNGDLEDKFPGLGEYVNTPMEVSDDHLIFKDADNPYPEVAGQLQQMHFEDSVQYLAIYLSPITEDESDPQKHRVYYRIKEELLKYGITSQVVERQKVLESNFRYALPNIAVAVLAKLGGIPWQLKKPPRPELLVGVGAFKPADMNKRYVGNAFCFSNDGRFRGFQCYTSDETTMLAGSIREAVRTYAAEKPDIERLVIHFYKRMSYRERKPIMEMLHNLGLDIPVIVVSINKTESRDVVLFDRANPEKIPVSGTFTSLRDHTILLCNNTRYRFDDRNLRSYPCPVKMRLSSTDKEILRDWDEVTQLVEQVYQFSRIYWKSVTQQNLPVTIKYPEMVAEKFPYFESRTMPAFGKRNLWFL